MTNNESPGQVLIHVGSIDGVWDSGLLDVKSNRFQRKFNRINVVDFGVNHSYEIGDNVLLLSDGSQHFVCGKIRFPAKNENGEATIHEFADTMSDLPGIKQLISSDNLGNMARVMVSRAAGIIMDVGESCLVYLDPNKSMFSVFARRLETQTLPMSMLLDHDAESASVDIVFRNKTDTEANERELTKDRDLTLDNGHTLHVEYKDNEDAVLSLTQRKDGETQWRLYVDPEGGLHLDHSQELEFDDDNPALAKMVHRMVMDTMDTVLNNLTMTSDFGRPMVFGTDFITGSQNNAARSALSEKYGDSPEESTLRFTKLTFKKMEEQ